MRKRPVTTKIYLGVNKYNLLTKFHLFIYSNYVSDLVRKQRKSERKSERERP